MRYELTDHEHDGYQADAAEQAARRATGERSACPQWHLLGAAIRSPMRDLPDDFGRYTTCYNRFVRSRRAGVWSRNALVTARDGRCR
jgi:transposase